MTQLHRPALALVALLTAAACGTTVPVTSTRVLDDGSGATSGLGGPAQSPVGTTGTAGTGTGGSTGTISAGTGAGSGSTSGGSSSGSTGGSAPGSTGSVAVPSAPSGFPESGRGYTKTTVKIGVPTAEDYDTFVGSTGLSGLDAGDNRGQMDAVVEEINKRGGLAGRRVVLVPHNYETAQVVSDPARAHEAACATWTQDNKVLAVMLPPLPTASLYECLKKANTPIINSGLEFPRTYQQTYAKYPQVFHVGAMVADLYDQLSVSRLVARGYFKPWNPATGAPGGSTVKVGVIVRNDNEGPRQEQSIRAALKAHGITPFAVNHCSSTINAASCMQSVELRYQSSGVTHVFGNSDLTFMNTADSQNYRPRYFMPGSLDTFAQNAPRRQLIGAMGESFTPSSDVPAAHDPGPPTPATTVCLAVMKKHGHDTTPRSARSNMTAICDVFNHLEAAVKLRGGLYDGVVQQGLESLGTSVPSTTTWATRLDPQHHAAVYGLRDLIFDNPCGCFVYTSKVTHTR